MVSRGIAAIVLTMVLAGCAAVPERSARNDSSAADSSAATTSTRVPSPAARADSTTVSTAGAASGESAAAASSGDATTSGGGTAGVASADDAAATGCAAARARDPVDGPEAATSGVASESGSSSAPACASAPGAAAAGGPSSGESPGASPAAASSPGTSLHGTPASRSTASAGDARSASTSRGGSVDAIGKRHAPPVDEIITDLVGELDADRSDLWERIRRGFGMPDLDDPLVRKWEAWYSERPDYVARMIERSRRYLYFVVAEVEERKMPLEVALLPMVESAFNPMAYSRSKASGIWQFIPSTGENFGLRQTWWSDARRDVIAATHGALDYLERLYGMFGDWQLALAAYNWGEGSVQRAQAVNRRRGLPEDYASIPMPDETRNYLPKLQAVKNIVADPARFGLALGDIPDLPYFKVVAVKQKIDVKRAAELAGMSVEDFRSLNPQHNRPVIVGGDEMSILLPYDRADAFVKQLALHDQPLVSWAAYRVRKGDSIQSIADRVDMSPEALRALNGIGPRSRVPVGHVLLVPVQRPSYDAAATLQQAVFRPVPPSPTLVHRVKKGETLQSIALEYGVSTGELREWNRLPGDRVSTGQRLRIQGDVPLVERDMIRPAVIRTSVDRAAFDRGARAPAAPARAGLAHETAARAGNAHASNANATAAQAERTARATRSAPAPAKTRSATSAKRGSPAVAGAVTTSSKAKKQRTAAPARPAAKGVGS